MLRLSFMLYFNSFSRFISPPVLHPSMKNILLLLSVCCLTKFSFAAPNFIVVYMDDLGWADTSVEMVRDQSETRSDFYETPNLEQLAEEGMVFSDAYAPAPVCTPSRNSILHGMTPARMLNTTLNTTFSKENYRGLITIPQAIKRANPEYVTAHYGKWHIGSISPEKAGYDVTENMKGTGNGEGDFMDDMKTFLPEEDPKRIFSLTEMSKKFMTEQVEADRPFYLQLSHYSVHIWHDSLKETRAKYRALPRPEKATDEDYLPEDEISESAFKHNWLLNYAAMVDDTDRAFGDLLAHLDTLGIRENTYVIFTSDNGGGLRGNKPLRGAKADLTEGGIRVPFIVRGPGIPKNSYCATPTAGWDLLPTLYDLAGGIKRLPKELDGVSLASAFVKGDAAKLRRSGDGALVFHFPWYNGEPESCIRRGEYKLLKNLDTRESALYNVVDDLSESNDLSEIYPEIAASLEDQLSDYLSEVGAEKVNQLREIFLKNLANWIPQGESKAETLRKQAATGDAAAAKQLQRLEKHIEWMKEQIIFTKERMALHPAI